jgi:hypothetical protein
MPFNTGFRQLPEDTPEPKISFFDVLKEVPSSTANVLGSMILKPGISIINTLKSAISGNNETYNPVTNIEKTLVGDKPIGNISQYGNETANTFGFNPSQTTSGIIGAILAPMDALFAPETRAVKSIANIVKETKSIDNILKELKYFKISDSVSKDIAPVLLKITDNNSASQVIKSAQIITKIESSTGKVVPASMRSEISQALSNTNFSDTKQASKIIDQVTDYFIDRAPKSQSVPVELKPLSELANQYKDSASFAKKMDSLFSKYSEAEKSGVKLLDNPEYQAYLSAKKFAENGGKFNFKDIFNIHNLQLSAKEKAKNATGKIKSIDVKKVVRENTGQTKSTIYRTTEEKLLREKMRIAQVYSKIGSRAGKTEMVDLQRGARNYISDLPKQQRVKILSQVSFSEVKTKGQLKRVLDKIDRLRTAYKNETSRLESLRDVRGLVRAAREKDIIGKIKIRARKELGITSDSKIKSASKETLEKYKKIIKEELDTTPVTKKRKWTPIEHVGSVKEKSVLKKIGEGLESGLGIVSTNIKKYGGEKLMSAMREYEFKLNRFSLKYSDEIKGFMNGMQKMNRRVFGDKNAYDEMAYSLYNQDFNRARELAKKFKFEKELDSVIGVLDDIHARANAAGLKVGKMENYFPRVVKDYDALFKAYNDKFGTPGRSYLDKLLTTYANKQYKKASALSIEERSDVLTNALRGYGSGKINVGSVGKSRKFKELPSEFLKFYHDPKDSLVMYISNMNKKIEMKKLFGLDGSEQESIGAMLDGMNLTPNDKFRLQENLGAILSPQGTENPALHLLRKSATITLLTNVAGVLFQVADIGKNVYKHGPLRALASLFRSKPIKRAELFSEIANEFSDSKVVSGALKAVGFDRLDRLNNEAFMANSFRESIRYAKKGSGSGFKKLNEYANVVFRGDKERISSFINDLKNKKITDDTRLYIFNKVLDVDPRSIIEMPESYAKHPNARIFYSMKSYGLKVLDMYRNDVIREKNKFKKVKNFVLLTSYLTAAGATGSQLRDWYNGKDSSLSDSVINSMLQLMMFSTYDVTNFKNDGFLKTLIGKALPPTRVADDIIGDIIHIGDGKGLNSIRNIPVIGNEYYNRFGRGREKIEKSNTKNSGSVGSFGSSKSGFKKTTKKTGFKKTNFK